MRIGVLQKRVPTDVGSSSPQTESQLVYVFLTIETEAVEERAAVGSVAVGKEGRVSLCGKRLQDMNIPGFVRQGGNSVSVNLGFDQTLTIVLHTMDLCLNLSHI